MKRFLLGAVLALTSCSPAFAQEPPARGPACAVYDEVKKILAERFGETIKFSGTDERGFQIEVFASDKKTWTLVMHRGAVGCLIASGKDYK